MATVLNAVDRQAQFIRLILMISAPRSPSSAGRDLLWRPDTALTGRMEREPFRKAIRSATPLKRRPSRYCGAQRCASPASRVCTTVTVICDGYCFEWCTALCATTPFASS